MSESATRAGRMRQLDGLRALAVLGVMLAHFSWTVRVHCADLGSASVRLFFVLSGFLITSILLRARVRVIASATTAGRELRAFYVRRALRIFPAFYAVLFVAAVLKISASPSLLLLHSLYAGNLYFALHSSFIDLTGHLWSLAVEEQFYLFWPCVVLFAPWRLLPWAIGALVVLGPLSRAALAVCWPENTVAFVTLTPACADHLGLGALLAWATHHGHRLPIFAPSRPLAVWTAVALGAFFLPWDHTAVRVLAPLVQSVAFVAIIAAAARGIGGAPGRILLLPVLQWIGQISYGLYLVHNFAHWWGPRVLRQLTNYRVAYLPGEFLHVVYYMALSFVGAALSWYVLEAPINRLKSRLRD